MAQRRILVVDDEENIGRSLRLILEREGYAGSLCSSIGEAKAYPQRADVTCSTCGFLTAREWICCAGSSPTTTTLR